MNSYKKISVLIMGLVLGSIISETVFAQSQQLPYEAVVESDNAYVRSGPGRSYYPTAKLKRNVRVMVHRHDPGGWYMITPPTDSFSYIRVDYIRRVGGNRGVVTENNVVVRVGSSFGDAHDVEQRRLSTGTEVEIIDEKTLLSERGPIRMYTIKPPKGEFRWIAGQSVVAINRSNRQTPARDALGNPTQQKPVYDRNPSGGKSDPFGNPRYPVADSNSRESGLAKRPVVRTNDNDAIRRSAPSREEIEEDRQRLKILDARFRGIIKQETHDWDFAKLENNYLQLQKQVSLPAFEGQIDLRLQALARYQKVKREYDEFIQLTKETDQRDAQLLTIQRQKTGKNRTNGEPVSSASQQRKLEPLSGSPARITTQKVLRFDGAGVVQRSATTYAGAPRYVLLALNGRILAYLQAGSGIDLNRYVGHAIGIYGKRSFRRDLQTDVITVRDLKPVRLKP